ncbi:hypothetical protein JK358_22485 [Nocardia sp. 2]|uniref:Secreted protein n=1 Tax=Nocardia acididurans TaxID=2802282 RepID=A0ABS1MAJ5_9NOCA|nr:hypothetical protein [Nocardia acididurans]MBL1077170.1 hypothetical protein [Nocardia acididurans]
MVSRGLTVMSVLASAGVGAALLTGVADADTGSSGSCSWGQELSPRTLDQFNVAFPDSAASYWILPYEVGPDTSITVTGTFPDARYMSFNTYDRTLSNFSAGGLDSALPDSRIVRDAGGDTFTVTVRPDAQAGQANTLPLAPSGVTGGIGFLIYRVYLPEGGPEAVALPSVTLNGKGATRTLGSCVGGPTNGAITAALDAIPQVGLPRNPTSAFTRVTGAGFFPNGDIAYLAAGVTRPADGRVIVVRGKAPAVPSPDMRYFSLCSELAVLPGPVVRNTLPDGSVDVGCRDDTQTALDASGNYTYVVADESQRAAVEAIPGATFVPWSLEHPETKHLLLFRNMLPAGDFAPAIQNVAPDSGPAHAEALMGAYYPRTAECSLGDLAVGACR